MLVGCSEYGLNGANDHSSEPGTDENTPEDGQVDPSETDDVGGISGRVCDPSGLGWVIDARVWIQVTDDHLIEARTDVEGRFQLESVPWGEWELHIEKGSFQASTTVLVDQEWVTLAEDECLSANVDIAVLAGSYDTTQDLLNLLSLDYDLVAQGATTQMDFLRSPAKLNAYDIVFLNCGMDEDWIFEARDEVAQNLRQFVQNGGSLYASDWTFQAVEAAFPGAVDFYGADDFPSEAYSGLDGSLQGEVLDPNMKALLASDTADIHYDLAGWVIAENADATSEVLVRGHPYTFWDDTPVANAPLAVRFQEGTGKVLFTTFHNEPQITQDMEDMLREIILSL